VGLIVDASVAVKWILSEPGSERAYALLNRDLHAPGLMLLEVGNALRSRQARGLLPADEVESGWQIVMEAPVTLHHPDRALTRRALQIALHLAHPIYDCLYLALAEALGLAMVTDDRRLIAAHARAPLPGVALVPLVPAA
jgi:predicted nucleic acid-binding protein